jgi:hypothetical protein
MGGGWGWGWGWVLSVLCCGWAWSQYASAQRAAVPALSSTKYWGPMRDWHRACGLVHLNNDCCYTSYVPPVRPMPHDASRVPRAVRVWPCLAATSDVWLQLAELATVGVPECGTECALLLDKELEAAVCNPARDDAFLGASRPVCP